MDDDDIMNKIMNELNQYGYTKKQIENGIRNVNIRVLWNIGSVCSIYSHYYTKWFTGKIVDIYTNKKTNEEWLIIDFNEKIRKHIQRFSVSIQPTDFDCNDNNYEIVKFIYNNFKKNKNECLVEETKEGEIITQVQNHWIELSDPPFDDDDSVSHILTLNETEILVIIEDINLELIQIWIYNIYDDNYTILIDVHYETIQEYTASLNDNKSFLYLFGQSGKIIKLNLK
eukprot:73792_1